MLCFKCYTKYSNAIHSINFNTYFSLGLLRLIVFYLPIYLRFLYLSFSILSFF